MTSLKTINLGMTASYTMQNPITKLVSNLTIIRWIDSPSEQKVLAVVKEIPGQIVIWSGDSYIAAGDWTEAQAEAQLIGIVTGTIKL